MAATAGVIWLCACVRYCRLRGWCLSVSFAFSCVLAAFSFAVLCTPVLSSFHYKILFLDNSFLVFFLFFAGIEFSIFLFFLLYFYMLAARALSLAPREDWTLINLSRAFRAQDGVELRAGVDNNNNNIFYLNTLNLHRS